MTLHAGSCGQAGNGSPHRAAIRSRLAAVLGTAVEAVSVKGTTTDGLGFLGRDEGLAAVVVAVLAESAP